ncbi:MAG: hypothetical protein ABSH26_06270 [Opitutaceae bacterium]|jgi:hypothetical protein
MKHPSLLALLPVVSISIGAQAFAAPQLPDRPASAITKYKDNWTAVVGATVDAPVIFADGTTVPLTSGAGILLTVGDHYADGFVTVTDFYSSDVPPTTDPDVIASHELKATQVDVKANLTSNVDIPDAYALLITYAPNPNPNAQQTLAVMARKIGDLTAGKEKSFSARLPKFGEDEASGWHLLVYDAGRQVKSTGMGEILPGYFDQIETAALKRKIAERLEKAADAPLGAFRQLHFSLPDAVKAKYHGTTVKVEIRVGTDGHVLWARPVGLSDLDLADALNKGFSGWLFLPPVKDGALVPGSAVIPLSL